MIQTSKKRNRTDPNEPYTKILANLPTSGLKAIFRDYVTLQSLSVAEGARFIVSNPMVCRLLAQRTGELSRACSAALGYECPVCFKVQRENVNI